MTYDNTNAGTVTVEKGKNPRSLYKHQEDALKELNKINVTNDINTLVVLPTGGGKTLTAVWWLLKNAVNNHDKVLWLAHRHLLLEQAAEAFVSNAYSDLLPMRTEFRYRIISGIHDKPIHIQDNDDVLICGKDSIVRSLSRLDSWMDDSDIYLVVDEAHHSVARTYKRIIEYVKDFVSQNNCSVKLIGLTATPFRTSEKEQASLGKLYSDDIAYKIDLDTLIKRGILSTPICKTYETNTLVGEDISETIARKISFSDNLPEDIAASIANNKNRNRLIVSKYVENRDKYQQTIVFALNVQHAIELKGVFKKYGIKADYIVSDIKDMITHVNRSKEDNARIIEEYKEKKLDVLINVNILTEGTDLPQTKTVFLSRPTVSRVLMTQMVGRALRGEAAGGTKEAYIVSFVDDWENKVAFESPESVLIGGDGDDPDPRKSTRRELKYIAVALIEEFARIVDETVDTSDIEGLPFSERIPLGMYLLSYMEENPESEISIERNYSVLVYNSSEQAYQDFLSGIDEIFKKYHVDGDSIDDSVIDEMISYSRETYFKDIVLPPVKNLDIESLLKYCAYSSEKPELIRIDDLTLKKLNLSYIAQGILEQHLDDFEKKKYLDERWNDPSTMLKTFYIEFDYFKRQLDKEIDKIVYGVVSTATPKRTYELRELEEFPLQEILARDPKFGMNLRNEVFKSAEQSDGTYKCVGCGMISPHKKDFQIDHIKPMAKGGKTVRENLQLLCLKCNLTKSDHEDDLPLAPTELSKDVLPSCRRDGSELYVTLGEIEKHYKITRNRKSRKSFSFTIGGIQYLYDIAKDQVSIAKGKKTDAYELEEIY